MYTNIIPIRNIIVGNKCIAFRQQYDKKEYALSVLFLKAAICYLESIKDYDVILRYHREVSCLLFNLQTREQAQPIYRPFNLQKNPAKGHSSVGVIPQSSAPELFSRKALLQTRQDLVNVMCSAISIAP